MSVCWGATDFGKGWLTSYTFAMYSIWIGYDLASQTPYLDDMLRWGLDWLMKVCS